MNLYRQNITLSVALIHNHNEERLLSARGVIQLLCSLWNGHVSPFEIFRQPKLATGSALVAASAIFQNQMLRCKWTNFTQNSFLRRVLCVPMTPFYFILGLYRFFLSRKAKNFYLVERFVTFKHIKAWEKFIKSNSTYLIVLEDDVLPGLDLEKNINNLFLLLCEWGNGKLYIDIAGGISIEKLNIHQLVSSKKDGRIIFNRPVTNTAAGYVLDRNLALHFLETLRSHSHFRKLPIDWLMNSIFMMSKEEKIHCIHYNPPLLIHGSCNGYVDSWQVKNRK